MGQADDRTLVGDLKNIFKGGFGKFYVSKARCSNCEHTGEIRVPKGTTVEEFLKGAGKCPNCGCNTLEEWQ